MLLIVGAVYGVVWLIALLNWLRGTGLKKRRGYLLGSITGLFLGPFTLYTAAQLLGDKAADAHAIGIAVAFVFLNALLNGLLVHMAADPPDPKEGGVSPTVAVFTWLAVVPFVVFFALWWGRFAFF